MSGRDADVIVIGSGPAGVSAAFPLVEAGRSVIMVDAGNDRVGTATDDFALKLGTGLEALTADDGLSPKLRTPVARAAIAPFQNSSALTHENFYVVGSLTRGGLSRVWGAFVAEFDRDDLRGWPISRDDLQPSYAAVTARIGISGATDDDTAEFFGSSRPILPPPPVGPAAASLLARYRHGGPIEGFTLGHARNALLTADRDGRRACDLTQGCLWGCPRGAIYDASHDLATLRFHPNFRLHEGATVTGLTPSGDGWDIRIAGMDRKLTAARVVLAAGPLGTARLALPLVARGDAGELPLLHSPVLASPLLVPALLGAPAPTQGYTLAQLGYRLADGAGGYVCGGLYETAALPPSSFVARLPLSRRAGTALFRALAPALVVATTYFSGALSGNVIAWRRTADGFAVSIRGGVVAGFDGRVAPVRRRLRTIWRRIGAVPLPGAAFAMPGTDAHLGGLFPMGGNGANATTPLGELRGAPGLHLVDASIFPSVPAKLTTLTVMANADRIARQLAASL